MEGLDQIKADIIKNRSKLTNQSQGTDPLELLTTSKSELELAKEKRQVAELEFTCNHVREQWGDECGDLPAHFLDRFNDGDGFLCFDKKLQTKAYQVISNWREGSVILLSPNVYGVGKTHLVVALCWRLLNESTYAWRGKTGRVITNLCPFFFTTEQKLLSQIRATFVKDSEKSDEEIYQKLRKFDLVVIDDVGKVRPRDYSFLQGVYFRVIDDRYSDAKHIILTTNLSLTELEAHIGGASADRLRQMCGENIIVMTGKSYRKSEAKK